MADWHDMEARRSLKRLLGRTTPVFGKDKARRAAFEDHAERHFPRLFRAYHALYGGNYDFFWHLEALLRETAKAMPAHAGSHRP